MTCTDRIVTPDLTKHPGLNGSVEDMLVLHRIGRLDLEENEAILGSLEHVDGYEDLTREEAGLEDGRRSGVERSPCRSEPTRRSRCVGSRSGCHPESAAEPALRPASPGQTGPEHLVRLQLFGLRLVDLPPEELGALRARCEAGL